MPACIADALDADWFYLADRLILDANWWPEPLLTGAAEEEGIVSPGEVDELPARQAALIMMSKNWTAKRGLDGNVCFSNAAEADVHSREA